MNQSVKPHYFHHQDSFFTQEKTQKPTFFRQKQQKGPKRLKETSL